MGMSQHRGPKDSMMKIFRPVGKPPTSEQLGDTVRKSRWKRLEVET